MNCSTLLREAVKQLCVIPKPVLFLGIILATHGALVQTSPLFAQEASADRPQSDIRFSLETNGLFGNYLYIPGQWGEFRLHLENSGETARDLLCVTYFGDQSNLQFGRSVWLPAHSRLNLSHPARLPTVQDQASASLNATSLVIDRTGGSEVLLKNQSGQLRHDRPLLLHTTERVTGIIAGSSSDKAVPQEVIDVVVAARVNQGLINKYTILSDRFLPADETGLKYLDHLVLAEDRLLDDEAALSAVRRWLHAGGRLWVMLDRVDPLILERLLGDDFHGRLVNRVELNQVRIDKASSPSTPDGEPGEAAEFEEPVTLARLVVSGMDVKNQVDGWPVAATMAVGSGRVLMTMLGPRAWIQPTPPLGFKQVAPPTDMQSPYQATSALEEVVAYVFTQRDAELLPAKSLEPLAQEHVSYRVPDWTLIVGTMTGFLVSLFCAAVLLRWFDALEHFGWLGSLFAVAFGIALTAIGLSSRLGVPGTVSSVQLAHVIGGTDDVRSHGVITVYRPEEGNSPIHTSQGGELWPDMSGLEGATRRMITTDLGTFQWDGLPQPVGLRTMSDETSGSLNHRIVARATLNEAGIVGRYEGHPISGTDSLLATRWGKIGVTMDAQNLLIAPADNVLEADQFIDASFLGDEQDRRRRMLQQLFGNPAWNTYLEQPQLLVWANDWNNGFQFGEGLSHQGDTLLVVPVELTRPAAGTPVLIPSPLLGFVTCRPPDGSLPAGFWNDARQEWQERSTPATTWMRFQIPKPFLPLIASKARVDVKATGPIGQIEILGVKRQAAVSLGKVDDPVGLTTFEITDADALSISDQGELTLGVSAGKMSTGGVQTGSSANWRLESLTLQIWATAADSAGNE